LEEIVRENSLKTIIARLEREVTDLKHQEEGPTAVNFARLELEAANYEKVVKSSGMNGQRLGLMLEEKTKGCDALQKNVERLQCGNFRLAEYRQYATPDL
jgi:hypothetical protein